MTSVDSINRTKGELKGFERVTLQPGETRQVTLPLGPAELGYWRSNAGKWIPEAVRFDLWAEADSTATLRAEMEVI